MLTISKEYLADIKYEKRIKEFEDSFKSHPNFPSLYAITDTLTNMGIDNVAARVDKEELGKLPELFLAILKNEIYLVKRNKDLFYIKDENGVSSLLEKNEFLNDWNGVVVVIEENIEIDENSKVFSYEEVLLGLFMISLFVLKFYIDSVFSILLISTFLLSFIGLFASLSIIEDKYGENKTSVISKICNHNSSTSCDSVINSNYSQITNWIEFSDLPIVYFTSLLISMFFVPTIHSEIILISCVFLPLIFYSVWLQKVKIKKWCPLCLLVSLVILLTSLLILIGSYKFNFRNWYSLFTVFTIISLLWFEIKSQLLKRNEIQYENLVLKRFKRNPEVFFKLLKPVYSEKSLEQFNKIVFGNEDAQITLSLILSPSCSYCHKAFTKAKKLQEKYNETVKIEFFFNVNPQNLLNRFREVTLLMLELNEEDKKIGFEALNDWHENLLGFDRWMDKWNNNNLDKNIINDLEEQYEWCQENDFNYTPVKLLNGKLLSAEYDIDDLKYFINELKPQEIY